MEIICKKKQSLVQKVQLGGVSSLDKQTRTIFFKCLFISNKGNTSISKKRTQTNITGPDLTGIMKMGNTQKDRQ